MNTVRYCKKCQCDTERNKRGDCKSCHKAYYIANSDKIKAVSAAYRAAHPEQVIAATQAWRSANQQYIKDSKAAYREKSPEIEKASQAAYRAANRNKMKRATEAWKAKNAVHLSEYGKRKWTENKPRALELKRERYKNDPVYAMCTNVRSRTAIAFSNGGFKKSSKTAELLCCTWDELKIHIEKQFVRGMSWENKCLWHIDHILPIGKAKTIDEVVALCHFTNLRPLWAEENFKKSAKNVFLI